MVTEKINNNKFFLKKIFESINRNCISESEVFIYCNKEVIRSFKLETTLVLGRTGGWPVIS